MKQDYGSKARIGILPPQANPTVEPEIGVLLPSGVSMLVNRLVSQGEPQQRFPGYFRNLESTLQGFDTLKLDVAGYACTASSYLLDESEELRSCTRLQEKFGYPVITAAAAIRMALKYLDAQRIALACPYPNWLMDHAVSFWGRQGFDIAASFSAMPQMDDTRAIYKLRGEQAARKTAAAFKGVACDVIVITGTGLASLQAICDLQKQFGVPVISSNLALAWACLRAARVALGERAPESGFPLLGGWQNHIKQL